MCTYARIDCPGEVFLLGVLSIKAKLEKKIGLLGNRRRCEDVGNLVI